MKIYKYLSVAAAGLVISMCFPAMEAQSETLRVVPTSTQGQQSLSTEQDIVLRHDISFGQFSAPSPAASTTQHASELAQVTLTVRFAEMERNLAKFLGSSTALSGTTLTTGRGVWPQNRSSTSGADSKIQIDFEGANLFGFDVDRNQIDFLLEAFEARGASRLLAAPNLTVPSGQSARFLAGAVYPVATSSGGGTASIEHRPIGVELKLIPTVLDGVTINIDLQTLVSATQNVNDINSGDIVPSTFSARRAHTSFQMRDGESFAISGILQDDFAGINPQDPWLHNLPVLGALFQSADYNNSESEFLIIITPHLVTPPRTEFLAQATDRPHATDTQDLFVFTGALDGTQQARPGTAIGTSGWVIAGQPDR